MDKIKDAIKCVNCFSIINSPVIFPCGHSICKHHAQSRSNNMIRCEKCGKDHSIPSDGFPNNESLASIIDTQVYDINLGEAYEQAKSDCLPLESLINQVNLFLADPSYQTREEIDEMRNRIFIKREELKQEIDNETEKLIDKLNQYVKRLSAQLDETEFKKCSSKLDSISREANIKLGQFKKQLDLFSLDVKKWESITDQVANEKKKLSDQLKSVRQLLIMSDFDDIQSESRSFQNSLWSYFSR